MVVHQLSQSEGVEEAEDITTAIDALPDELAAEAFDRFMTIDAHFHELGPFAGVGYRLRKDRALSNRLMLVNPPPIHIVNLAQDPQSFGYSSSRNAPRLLRGSYLYDLVSNREILPLQHLLIQGFPVPGWAPAAAAHAFPFPGLINATMGPNSQQLSDTELRSLTGDGMHWNLLGSVILFSWAMYSFDASDE